MWIPYGVWLGEFIFPCVLRWSPCYPDGLWMDSRQKIGWAVTKEKLSKLQMDSRY